MDDENRVGYGNPPKKNRWKKGQSGNPKGRPKTHMDIMKDAAEILSEPVKAQTADGKTVYFPAFEAAYFALCKRGLNGDVPSLIKAINIMLEFQPVIDARRERENENKGAKQELAKILGITYEE